MDLYRLVYRHHVELLANLFAFFRGQESLNLEKAYSLALIVAHHARDYLSEEFVEMFWHHYRRVFELLYILHQLLSIHTERKFSY